MDGVERLAPLVPATKPVSTQSTVVQWLLHDSPYIAMLLLALTAVVLRVPVTYWVILVPIFALISGAEGWRHFAGRTERVWLMLALALNWCALLLAIFLLFNTGVQGSMNANANSLVMMILLALGTFVAGVQSRVWQICAVGGLLFAAVPALGWLDQSPLQLAAAAFAVIALGGMGWWLTQWQQGKPAAGANRPSA